MMKEPIRRSLALGGLGLASLALFAFSTKGHEVPEVECARLLQAKVTTPIESITANPTVFPFGIVCRYESDGETFMVSQTTWFPLVPLAGGILLVGAAAASIVKSRSSVEKDGPE